MKLKQALLHNTGWRVITMLFTFLNNILIVRILGVEASANFFYALAAFTLLSTILRIGLENGIVYFVSKRPDKTKAVSLLILLILFLQTILTIIILNIYAKEITGFTFLWCVVFIMSNVIVYYVSAFYQVKRMYISLNISACFIVLCQTIFLYYLYISGIDFLQNNKISKNSNDLMLIISGIGILLQMIFLCFYFYKQHKNDFKLIAQTGTITKSIFSYSLNNFGVTVLLFLVLRADLFFVEKYCDKIALGNYVQAAKIGQMLLVFPGLIAGVIFPFTINAAEALAGKVALLCRLLTVVYFTCFILFLLIGPYIFTWMLGGDFKLMYSIFIASFLGVYFLSISLLLVSYFEGVNKQVIILWALLITFIIIISADYFLVPAYGYMAAAVIFSIANFVGMFMLLKAFNKKTGIRLNKIFLFKLNDLNSF